MIKLDWDALRLATDEDLPWDRYNEIKEEAKEAQKTYWEARSIVNDAQLRYKKKKLNARNKKQAADMQLMFADIKDYRNEEDIRDAYGWDIITEKEMNRLIELWRTKEKYLDENGKYSDPVTDLLDEIMEKLYEPYLSLIGLSNRMEQIVEVQKREKMVKTIITSIFGRD